MVVGDDDDEGFTNTLTRKAIGYSMFVYFIIQTFDDYAFVDKGTVRVQVISVEFSILINRMSAKTGRFSETF